MESNIEATVVGLPYYEFNKHKSRIKQFSKVHLIPEPDNVHSTHAIRVEFEGNKIGYVSGRESESLLKYVSPLSRSIIATVSELRNSCIKVTIIVHVDINYTLKAMGVAGPVKPIVDNNINITKEETMMDKIVNTNKQMAKSAAYLEAGRIANKAATKAIASRAPLMVRGYVETAFGKLVIANLAAIAADKVRPGDARLAKLANAMITEAYQEVYQEFDIEKMLTGMLENETVKAALNKLDSVDVNE